MTIKQQYISERYDCDNFAISLAGDVARRWDINGVGIVVDFSGRHAYSMLLVVNKNVYGDEELSIAVVEPQTDQYIIKDEGMYAADRGYIILA